MRSMTGYGRGEVATDEVRVVVDVRAGNHKGLDIKVRLPRESAQHELHVIRLVQASVQRGRIDVTCEAEARGAARAAIDVDGVTALVGEVRRLAGELGALPGITEGDVLRAALQLRRTTPAVDDSAALLLDAVAQALAAVEESRAREGAALHRVLGERLASIARLGAELATRARAAPLRAGDRLRARLALLTAELTAELDPARLAQEVALLADRLDVTEELERLAMHVALGHALLAAPEPTGRKLDFLCQELLREANTAGSKLQDAAATHLVVELKSEIERLREQAQNVE